MDYREELVNLLDKWEEIAFFHEKEFMKEFCHNCPDLLNIYWNSKEMKVIYFTDDYTTISDSVKIEKWFEFIDKIGMNQL